MVEDLEIGTSQWRCLDGTLARTVPARPPLFGGPLFVGDGDAVVPVHVRCEMRCFAAGTHSINKHAQPYTETTTRSTRSAYTMENNNKHHKGRWRFIAWWKLPTRKNPTPRRRTRLEEKKKKQGSGPWKEVKNSHCPVPLKLSDPMIRCFPSLLHEPLRFAVPLFTMQYPTMAAQTDSTLKGWWRNRPEGTGQGTDQNFLTFSST